MTVSSLLIPHDGSVLSGSVVESLGPLLRSRPTVMLLHVVDGDAVDRGVLDEARRRLVELGARVEIHELGAADPAAAIVDMAHRWNVELIAMSTNGRSGMDRWTRGSVSERVLRMSPVPVFMINPRTSHAADLSSILLPVDGSGNSGRILDTLLPMAIAYAATLTLLFVDWDDPTDTPARAARRRAVRERDVEQWLAAPRSRIEAAGVDCRVRIVQGDVAEQILQAAQPDAYDLLAMTTHGRSGAGRLVLGSVAEKVLAACRIPILLLRLGDDG